MIHLTRLNHIPLVINSDLIEHIEITPDTVIALTTGQKFLVRETPDEVIERVIRFRQAIFERCKANNSDIGIRAGLFSPAEPSA